MIPSVPDDAYQSVSRPTHGLSAAERYHRLRHYRWWWLREKKEEREGEERNRKRGELGDHHSAPRLSTTSLPCPGEEASTSQGKERQSFFFFLLFSGDVAYKFIFYLRHHNFFLFAMLPEATSQFFFYLRHRLSDVAPHRGKPSGLLKYTVRYTIPYRIE